MARTKKDIMEEVGLEITDLDDYCDSIKMAVEDIRTLLEELEEITEN